MKEQDLHATRQGERPLEPNGELTRWLVGRGAMSMRDVTMGLRRCHARASNAASWLEEGGDGSPVLGVK